MGSGGKPFSFFSVLVGICLFLNFQQNADAIITPDANIAVDSCEYPGIGVLVGAGTNFFCTGVLINGDADFILPPSCMNTLNLLIPTAEMVVQDVDYTWTFAAGTTLVSTQRIDGSSQLSLANAVRGTIDSSVPPCTKTSKLYDGSEALNTATCRLLGFGASKDIVPFPYDQANLRAATIDKSYSATCCKAIMDSLSPLEKGLNYKDTSQYNCLISSGSPCGISDTGAPVMCDTVSGQKVILGIAASNVCDPSAVLVLYDLTGESSETKFGLTTG